MVAYTAIPFVQPVHTYLSGTGGGIEPAHKGFFFLFHDVGYHFIVHSPAVQLLFNLPHLCGRKLIRKVVSHQQQFIGRIVFHIHHYLLLL